MASGGTIIVTRHYIQAHSPFTPCDSNGYCLAVCDKASKVDIQEDISLILDTVIALLEMVIKEQEDTSTALWGLAYLLRVAKGLSESIQ